MKFKTDHNFYAPTFDVLADLLDKDYEIKYDHTDDSLGISATVVSKKYKNHGIHISTYLGSDPEWSIGAYVNLPIKMIGLSKYTFRPEEKENGFPKLSDTQIKTLKTKIKAIEKRTLMDIKEFITDIEDGLLGMTGDEINSYYEDGFDVVDGFENYGVNIDYTEFFIQSYKNDLIAFRLIQGLFNSKNPKIASLTNQAIWNYLQDAATARTRNDALKMVSRFQALKNGDDIVHAFNDENIKEYKKVLESWFHDFDPEMDAGTLRQFIRVVDANEKLESELLIWAYDKTDDEHFLPDSVKELFIF